MCIFQNTCEITLRVIEIPNIPRDWGIYIVAGIAAVTSSISALIAYQASASSQKRQESAELAKMVQGSALQAIQDISSIGFEDLSTKKFRALRNSVRFILPSTSEISKEIRTHLQKGDTVFSAEEFEAWQEELVTHFSKLLDDFWAK